jgi:hypothetical protein
MKAGEAARELKMDVAVVQGHAQAPAAGVQHRGPRPNRQAQRHQSEGEKARCIKPAEESRWLCYGGAAIADSAAQSHVVRRL